MLDKNSSEEQLKSSRKETERLRAENARLRAMLGIPDSAVERGSPPEVNAVETLNSRAIEGLTQREKLLFFEACFAVEKTFTQYAGKEKAASLAILRLVSWTGARFTLQDRKNERRFHGRHERFNRSPIAQSAITSLGSRLSASILYFPTKPVGFSPWISTRSLGWQTPQLLLPHVGGFRSPCPSSARDQETVRTFGFSSTTQCSLPMPDSLVAPC